MPRGLPLDAVDSRTTLVLYAVAVGAAGLFITLWGSVWVGGPLNDQPWGVHSITRIAGAALAALGACAFAFSRVQDPADRSRALRWFVGANGWILLIASIQMSAVWAGAVSGSVLTVFYGFVVAFWLLVAGVASEAGDRSRRWTYVGLFGTPPPSPLTELRSQYEQQMRQAGAQEERNRLARDLHDSVKQQIFAIQTAAATAETRFASDPEGARAALAQVRGAARDSMAEMEAMVDQLRATPIEGTGLIEALRRQCEAVRLRTGADVVLDAGRLPPAEMLPPGSHQALFRAAQEALSNVARHARASRVTVSLKAADGRVVLNVVDNGVGLAGQVSQAGMGLENIRARAAELGGTAEILSGRDGGTVVAMSIPTTAVDPKAFCTKVVFWGCMVTLFVVSWIYEGFTPRFLSLFLPAFAAFEFTRYLVAWRRARRLGMVGR